MVDYERNAYSGSGRKQSPIFGKLGAEQGSFRLTKFVLVMDGPSNRMGKKAYNDVLFIRQLI